MDKVISLKKIKEAMEHDKTLPLVNKSEDIIAGDGSPNTKIMFIGEAGGYYESIQRKPFVGAAGQLLNKLLESINLKRENVYITNIVKTRPPDNRDPLPEEIKAFEKYLDQEIEIIEPKIIVTLGRFSMAKFFPFAKISQIHGKPAKVDWQGRQIIVIPMYHPAAALRSSEVMAKLKEDFKEIAKVSKELEKTKSTQLNLL